jgi:chromosome segregation ATPase
MLIILLQAGAPGLAQANNEALARAQFMLRQLDAEKNQLAAEGKTLKAENAELRDKLEALQKKYQKLEKKSAKSSNLMSDRLADTSQRLEQESIALDETSKKLQAMIAEKDRLFEIATEQTGAIDLCVSNNRKLYEINQQLLGKYEDKGVWSVLSQAEPFTGLKQVEIENLIDDYQYQLDDLRVEVPESEIKPNL